MSAGSPTRFIGTFLTSLAMTSAFEADIGVATIPGDTHIAVLNAVVPIIAAEQLANPGANVEKAVTDLVDGSYAKAVLK